LDGRHTQQQKPQNENGNSKSGGMKWKRGCGNVEKGVALGGGLK